MKRTIFQTVKYTGDKTLILTQVPIYCKDRKTELREKTEWLGDGYYFWETFDVLGHWWGYVRYIYNGEDYVICRTEFECPEDEMLDLVSNTEQMLDIQNMVEEMKKNKIFGAKKYTAQFIINFIREKTPFDYKAIRAWGRDAANHNSIRRHIYPFNQKSTLSLCPEIQICVIDKSVIRLPMTIHYCSNDEAIDSLTV